MSVLCAETACFPIIAGTRAPVERLAPTVFIENRMDPDPARSFPADCPAGIQSEWRIICTRDLRPAESSSPPASSRAIRLAPGQGVRVRLAAASVTLERFNEPLW